jgi:ABC-type phosphate/phosphonate transport system substrate-binding protein
MGWVPCSSTVLRLGVACCLAVFLVISGLMIGSVAAVDSNPSETDTLRIGYSVTTLLAVSPSDVEAATNVLVKLIARKMGREFEVEATVFDNLAELVQEVESDRLHIVSLLSHEYLELSERLPLDPISVPLRNGKVNERAVLLAGKERANAGLESLAGKRLLLSVNRPNEIPYLWLDGILLSANLPRAQDFFGSIEEVVSPSRAVLPVFFEQADACVTLESSFQTLTELNPQIGKKLVPLKVSQPLLMSVLCVNRRLKSGMMDTVRTEIHNLSDYPEGRQLLMVFGMDGQVPFKDDYLRGIREMVQKTERLRLENELP